MPNSLARMFERPFAHSSSSGELDCRGTEPSHLLGDNSHHYPPINSDRDGPGVSDTSQQQNQFRPPLGSRTSSVASFTSAQLQQQQQNPVSAYSHPDIQTLNTNTLSADPSSHVVPATGDTSSSPFFTLSSLSSSHLPPSANDGSEMIFHEHLDHLEIALASDNLVLRGVGQNFEPAVLSGNVVLNLPEATNIRQINLSFYGKAKMPHGDSRQPHVRHHQATHLIYQHDWSFLEGAKSHRHTLKAGKHVFPFVLHVDNQLPCSIQTPNASVTYKLRATVIRSAFSSNWVATRNIEVIRAFMTDALEYTQTLEIENTWPGKIMYSVLIPHKAYAAGDEIPILVKFTPMAKGVNVISVDTQLKEYSSVKTKNTISHQDSRIFAMAKHVIQDGKAVDLSCIGNRAMMEERTRFDRSAGSSNGQAEGSSTGPNTSQVSLIRGDGEIDTMLRISIPKSATPTHSIDPAIVTHKIKWSIIISNLDGHTSELRCALPIHILHHSLLSEARGATRDTRAILFGTTSSDSDANQSVNLPSYASHVHDRVANALDGMPSSLGLAPNPLHHLDSSNTSPAGSVLPTPGGSPSGSNGIFHNVAQYISDGSGSTSPSISPGPRGLFPTNLDDPMGLEYVDSGLLLSLGGTAAASVARNSVSSSFRGSIIGSMLRVDTPPGSGYQSRRESRASSRVNSRASSRAASPERGFESLAPSSSGHSHHGSSSTVHGQKDSTHSSHKSGGFFSLGIKPFTPFSKSNKSGTSTPSHSSGAHISHQPHSATFPIPSSPPSARASLSRPGSRPPTRPSSRNNLRGEFVSSDPHHHSHSNSQHNVNPEVISQLLSRVPDYERASRGFLGGGVTPLDASRGLPTYDEVERISRVTSEGSLLEFGRRHNADVSGVHSMNNSISLATPRSHQPLQPLPSISSPLASGSQSAVSTSI
ncbi:hypothetical protein FRC03_009622 [Tulasnella sp. 419]|nr:hypothetical protein FRC03_009622 [Tulasnella sp. 419]